MEACTFRKVVIGLGLTGSLAISVELGYKAMSDTALMNSVNTSSGSPEEFKKNATDLVQRLQQAKN